MKELEIEAVKFSPTAKENIVQYDVLLSPKIAINDKVSSISIMKNSYEELLMIERRDCFF
ncbi:MAG: hypothetical protein ACLFU9_02175 [Candidatus Bathyarchaeia archaeon]